MATFSAIDTLALHDVMNNKTPAPPAHKEDIQDFNDVDVPEQDTNTDFETTFGVPTPSGQVLKFWKFRDEDWPEEVRCDIPKVDPNHVWDYEWLELAIISRKLGLRMVTYGPAGSGKTTSHEQLCAVLRQPYHKFNGAGDMLTDDIIAKTVVQDGELSTQLLDLPIKMQQGYVVLFDECWRLPSTIQMSLQRFYERGGKLHIPGMVLKPGEPASKRLITPHKHFSLFLADNTAGNGEGLEKYVAGNIQDQSSLNRMDVFYHMEYLKPEKEQEIIQKKFPNISEQRAEHMVQFANQLRSSVKTGKLNMEISPRQLEAWGLQIQALNDYIRPMKYVFMNRVSDDNQQTLIKNQFETVFGMQVN